MLKTSKNAASEAKDLERSYKLSDIVKQRQKTLRTLDLQPGEKVYDIGCGVGFLAHEMALLVGESGYVIPSTDPGLGVELNEEVALAHPYSDKELHLEIADKPVE